MASPGQATGQILRVAGPSATVLIGGEQVEVPIAPRIGLRPVVGDIALLRERPGDLPELVGVGPRRTLLQRGGGREGQRRDVVANADLLLVVAAVVDPPLHPRLVDRYLVAGHFGGLEPSIVLTKTDLPHDKEMVAVMTAEYRQIGYPVLAGVATDPVFHAELAIHIGTQIGVLAGHSGVGKSTLTRGLTGVDRQVGEISQKAGKGRHTTTDPRLIPMLKGPGAVVDTAGVRSFFIPPMQPDELAAGFPEIAAAAARCRFRGCRHAGDAGCVVEKEVSARRLDSYRRLLIV